MTTLQFLEAARKFGRSLPPDELLDCVRYTTPGDEFTDDENADFRSSVFMELLASGSSDDRLLLHFLLDQEKLNMAEGGMGDELKLCCYLLFRIGAVEDSLAI